MSKMITKESIALYWSDKIYEGDLNCDVSEFLTHCWNCGCERNTEKCHIIPKSLDGPDIPSNYVLLCKECHNIAPNCRDSEIMWQWIKSNKTTFGFYGQYYWEQAWREYERIYQKNLFIILGSISMDYEMKEIIGEVSKWCSRNMIDNFSLHFGKGITVATRVGMLKQLVDYLINRFPDKRLIPKNKKKHKGTMK